MRCPVCGIECRTDSSTQVLKFICRNKQCPQCDKTVGEKPPDMPVQKMGE